MTKTQAETKLSRTVLETWKRLRSSSELQSFIARREFALAEVETIDA